MKAALKDSPRKSIMTSFRVLRPLCWAIVFASAWLAAFTQSAAAVDISLGSLKANKILFLGNSITCHPYRPSIGWYGTWGMAASSADKDFVHVLTSKIATTAGATPTIKAVNIAEAFELAYNTCNPEKDFAAEIAFKPDIIVLAVGENVPALGTPTDQANYANAFANLLDVLKKDTGATIFTRSCFWPDATKDGIMKTATLAADDYFVDISSLSKDAVNYAYGDPASPFKDNTTINTHPGDTGMANIAGLLYDSMAPQPVPEPSCLTSLVLAGLCLAGALGNRQAKRSRDARSSSSPG
jgi:alpha-galactosidase